MAKLMAILLSVYDNNRLLVKPEGLIGQPINLTVKLDEKNRIMKL